MLQKLQSDVFVFSGMKTYTQLKEASLLLLDENKQIKPYHKFEQDILKIDNTYNKNYLQAEYQHATSAAQSASQWNDYMKDGDRYNLQIRTAGDDRVRESHAVLNGITLPAKHEFWKTHWTPFDWRCRCNIVQVLRDDYTESDIGIAHAAAEQAIPEMFRYNPGREGVIFPKKHPYYPQHCNGAKLNVTGLVGFANWLLDAENDRCKAKRIIEDEVSKMNNSTDAKKRNEMMASMKHLYKRNVIKPVENGYSIKVTFNKRGNEHIANDMLTKRLSINKKDTRDLHILIDNARFVKSSPLHKKRNDDIQRFYYYKDKYKNMYYNVAETARKIKSGKIKIDRFLYSITNEISEKK